MEGSKREGGRVGGLKVEVLKEVEVLKKGNMKVFKEGKHREGGEERRESYLHKTIAVIKDGVF